MAKASFVPLSRAAWKQEGFRQIVGEGIDRALLAFYIMTAPNGNMTGVFELTLYDIARHTGLDQGQAISSLHSLINLGFCKYDFDAEYVWDIGAIQRHLRKSASPQQIKGVINNFARLAEEEAVFVKEAYSVFKSLYPDYA